MTKAESGCWKLPLKPTEVQEETAKLAAAKEISVNAAVVTSFIRTGWYFKIKRRIKNTTFLSVKQVFTLAKVLLKHHSTSHHTRLMTPFTTVGNLKLLLSGSTARKTSDCSFGMNVMEVSSNHFPSFLFVFC